MWANPQETTVLIFTLKVLLNFLCSTENIKTYLQGQSIYGNQDDWWNLHPAREHGYKTIHGSRFFMQTVQDEYTLKEGEI